MSALGHKPTFAVQKGMSALPPRADMCSATRDVRYVPRADIRVRHPLGDMSGGRRPYAAAGATVNREFESHLGALLLDGN